MFTDRQRRIVETAKQHDDMYLLARRHRASNPPTELDLDYQACDALAASGHAIKLPALQYYDELGGPGPGIRLTGKPE